MKHLFAVTASAALAATGAWWTRFIAPTQTYSLPLSFGAAGQRVGELKVVTAQALAERFLAAGEKPAA